MALTPPTGALWTAVSGRAPDLWPADSEETAAELATTLTGVADSLGDTHQATTRTAGMTSTTWTDEVGGDMTDRLTQSGTRMAGLADQVRQRAAGAQTYATELTGAKTDITTTMAANEPVFTALGGLPAPFGAHFQGVFADLVADGLQQSVDQRVQNVSQIQLPFPPTHDELMRRYQVPDDPRGMTTFFGFDVTATEADLLNGMWPWELADFFAVYQSALDEAPDAFPGEGRPGALDNHRDAFRHAYWNAQLTDVFGADRAAQLTTAHEGNPDPTPRDNVREAMDLHNNEVGRQIAQAHPGASQPELRGFVEQAVREGRLVVIDDNGRLVPSDYDFQSRR